MTILLTILLFTSVTTLGQVTKKISEQTTFVNAGQFKGVIFSADYELPIFDHADKSRFTPTIDEVMKFEKELMGRIKEINKNRPNQGGHYGPIIDKRLSKYSRQYAGFINDRGERIIHVGLNWRRHDEEWKTDFILVFDGGSYHWTIRYNLDKDDFFHFGVNGIAGVPNASQQCIKHSEGSVLHRSFRFLISFGVVGERAQVTKAIPSLKTLDHLALVPKPPHVTCANVRKHYFNKLTT